MSKPPQKPAIAFSARKVRTPAHPDVNEEMICELVHSFYAKVQKDTRLGPVFAAQIKGDWGPHLRKMCDFWSSVMLKTGRFKGNPMQKHMALDGLSPELFAHWLVLFRETAREVAGKGETGGADQVFIEKAEIIAASLQNGLFFRPEKIAPKGQG